LSSFLGKDADLLISNEPPVIPEPSPLDIKIAEYQSMVRAKDDPDSNYYKLTGFRQAPYIVSIEAIRSDLLAGLDHLVKEQIDFLKELLEATIVRDAPSSEMMITDMMALALFYMDRQAQKKIIMSLQPFPRTALLLALCNLPPGWTIWNAAGEAVLILQSLDDAMVKEMMDLIGNINGTLAEQLSMNMLTFEDVAALDPAEIRHLMSEMPLEFVWVLKYATPEAVEKIFNALPSKTVQTIHGYLDAELLTGYGADGSLSTILEYAAGRHTARALLDKRLARHIA
jgi:hypothetical protein